MVFVRGDPTSPYMYLICAKGHSFLLNEAETISKIKGVKVERSSPTFNHIFFANYSIIFCRAAIGDWNEVQKILDIYEAAFGQEINKHKTWNFFSSNINPPT